MSSSMNNINKAGSDDKAVSTVPVFFGDIAKDEVQTELCPGQETSPLTATVSGTTPHINAASFLPHTEADSTQANELSEHLSPGLVLANGLDEGSLNLDTPTSSGHTERLLVEISNRILVFTMPEGMSAVLSFVFIEGLGYVLTVILCDWRGISGAVQYLFPPEEI